MGTNRSGKRRTERQKKAKRETARLARKAASTQKGAAAPSATQGK
jgi:hypothetical protein